MPSDSLRKEPSPGTISSSHFPIERRTGVRKQASKSYGREVSPHL